MDTNLPPEPNASDAQAVGAAGDGLLSLAARVESLLFVADAPVTVSRLAAALDVTPGRIERALASLAEACAGRGLRLQRDGNRVQFITAPESAECVERFLGLSTPVHLSRAALETLAIIAYRQPVIRRVIEAVRGVGSDSVLRTLLSAGLIEEAGRAASVGRPILYATTFEFLQHFGLQSLSNLPPMEEPQSVEGA